MSMYFFNVLLCYQAKTSSVDRPCGLQWQGQNWVDFKLAACNWIEMISICSAEYYPGTAQDNLFQCPKPFGMCAEAPYVFTAHVEICTLFSPHCRKVKVGKTPPAWCNFLRGFCKACILTQTIENSSLCYSANLAWHYGTMVSKSTGMHYQTIFIISCTGRKKNTAVVHTLHMTFAF